MDYKQLIPKDNFYKLTNSQAIGLLLRSALIYILFTKKLFSQQFLQAYRIIAMGVVSVILQHINQTSSTTAQSLVISSYAFQVSTTLIQIIRIVFSGHTGEILSYSRDVDAIIVTVRLKRLIKVRPGFYFYLYLPLQQAKYNFLHSVTAIVYQYPPKDSPGAVREVTFLLSRTSYNTAIVTVLQEGQFILLNRPYRQDLKLHKH